MEDIIKKKFGKLIVKELSEIKKKPAKNKADYTKFYYLCECECGKSKIIERGNLLSDHTLSCGCLKNKKAKDNKCWTGYGDISGRTWYSIKRHAETRKLPFNITIQDAWEQFEKQKSKCALTGWEINLLAPKDNYSHKTASLDRINSAVGYEKHNIQWLHKDVNRIKLNFTTERFIEICEAVANNKENLCF